MGGAHATALALGRYTVCTHIVVVMANALSGFVRWLSIVFSAVDCNRRAGIIGVVPF